MIADFHIKHPALQRDAFFMTTDEQDFNGLDRLVSTNPAFLLSM